TTLRMIAGLEDISDGDIMIGGDVVNDVPPKDRDIAMVFQNYALYPHMTVAENMSFGLRLKRYPKAEIKSRVDEAARMLDIVELVDRKPKQLSGGQRQRVAMGRAIVRNPKVFLFDEPLSNLDAKLRVQMRIEIKKVHQKVRTTTVYVTHDQVEAMTLADRVVVMNHGRIEQIGAPNDLYHNPATRFVAGFIGSPAMNFVPCRLEDVAGKLHIRLTDRIAFPLPPKRAARYQGIARNEKLLLGLRPEHIAEAKAHPQPGVEAFDTVLDDIELVEFPNMISAGDFEAMLKAQAPVHGVALGATRFGEPELEASKDMKVVTRIGVGFDSVDVPALSRRKIPLMVAGAANSPS